MSDGGNGNAWKFEWLTRWDEVWDRSFVGQWQKWMSESPTAHVFFEPALVRAWYETYRDLRRIEPRFLIARMGTDATVFLPLVYDRGGWKDAWERSILPVGHCEFDFHDPIASFEADGAFWATFWSGLAEELASKRTGHFEVAAIPRMTATTSGNGEAQVDAVPWMDLTPYDSIDKLLAGGRHKKKRHEVRREREALEASAPVSFHRFAPDDQDGALRSIRGFAEAHRKRWPDTGTPYAFYDLLVQHVLTAGLLCLTELRHGDRPISWRVDFGHKGRLRSYVIAYAADMAEHSPGRLHLVSLLEHALTEGLRIMDFGRGMEVHKSQWTDLSYPLYCLEWRGRGVRPKVCRLWQERLRPGVVAAKRWLVGRRG